MTNARLDSNGRASMTTLLNTDGSTIVRVTANASTNSLKVDNNATGSDNGGNHSKPDENTRGALFAESSAGDGSFVALYTDSSGNLLINSN